jgi:large subunit ribosomal protein L4
LRSPSAPAKAAKAALEKLGAKHALVILGEGEEGFLRAARNLAAHKILPIAGLNVYDILNYNELVMTSKTLKAIEDHLVKDVR